MTCGAYHSVAIASGLFAWGRAEGGQLGLPLELCGDDLVVPVPTRLRLGTLDEVAVDLAEKVTDLETDAKCRFFQASCGDVHSCAVTADGELWSWGWGEFGQLGLGISSARFPLGEGAHKSKVPFPRPVSKAAFDDQRIKQVACGGAFTLTLCADGQVWGFGSNEQAQLARPLSQTEADSPVPLPLSGIVYVAAGSAHALAIDLRGQVYGWGSDQLGQLGLFTPDEGEWVIKDGSRIATRDYCVSTPRLLPSISRIRIAKAGCGRHHSLLLNEPHARKQSSSRAHERV